MADAKISDLSALGVLDGTEEFVVADSGASKKITGADAAPYFNSLQEADDVAITDTGSFFTSTDVEGALQELGAGGGGAGWIESFDEDGSSLSNWTQVSGSWSVVSAALHVDATGGIARLKYNTAQQSKFGTTWVMEADVMIESSGVGSNAPAGFLFYWPGSSSGSPTAQLFHASGGAKQIRGEQDATAARLAAFTPSPTWALDAYSNLKIYVTGTMVNILLDDVAVAHWASPGPGPGQSNQDYGHTVDQFVGFVVNLCKANFKNITLNYLPLPV